MSSKLRQRSQLRRLLRLLRLRRCCVSVSRLGCVGCGANAHALTGTSSGSGAGAVTAVTADGGVVGTRLECDRAATRHERARARARPRRRVRSHPDRVSVVRRVGGGVPAAHGGRGAADIAAREAHHGATRQVTRRRRHGRRGRSRERRVVVFRVHRDLWGTVPTVGVLVVSAHGTLAAGCLARSSKGRRLRARGRQCKSVRRRVYELRDDSGQEKETAQVPEAA